MTDVVFAIADDLDRCDGAVAVVDADVKVVLLEQAALLAEVERSLIAPRCPIQPYPDRIGGDGLSNH